MFDYLIQQQKFKFFYTHKHHATIIFFNKDYPNGYCEELFMVNICLCIFPLTIWKEIIRDIIISFAWRSTCLALACKLRLIYHYLLQCNFLLSFAFFGTQKPTMLQGESNRRMQVDYMHHAIDNMP